MRTRQEDKVLKLFHKLKNSIKAALLYFYGNYFYLSLSRSYKAYFPTLSCLISSFVARQTQLATMLWQLENHTACHVPVR